MEPTSTSAAAASTKTPSAARSAASQPSNTGVTSDFETFLKMMTTQLKNQDPLNPLDSAEFALQLATFSGVEQQVQTNKLLEQLGAQMALTGMSELANYVGMEARVVSKAKFDGSPIEMTLDLLPKADSGVLVVRDEAGNVKQRLSVDKAASYHLWDGTDDQGAQLPPGTYNMALEHYKDGGLIETTPVPIYTKIEEARLENGATVLLLSNGESVPSSEITALRFPVSYTKAETSPAGEAASADDTSNS